MLNKFVDWANQVVSKPIGKDVVAHVKPANYRVVISCPHIGESWVSDNLEKYEEAILIVDSTVVSLRSII